MPRTVSFSKLKDPELLAATSNLVAKERAITTEILHAILEIETRRLHVQRGFSSLHEFVVKYLGYSDGAAHRRISAARLLKSVPELELCIAHGSMNLTTVAAAQDFFASEKRNYQKEYSKQQKLCVLSSIRSKSKSQCEQVFQSISPERRMAPRPEVIRQRVILSEAAELHPQDGQSEQGNLGNSFSQNFSLELRMTIRPELQLKLQRLKEIFSHHKESSENFASLFELMADKLLKTCDPLKKERRNSSKPAVTSPEKSAHAKSKSRAHSEGQIKTKTPSRYVPVTVKDEVFKRDGAQCAYIDSRSQKRCEARRFLEVDHIIPISVGGKTSTENCRLLCSTHNKYAAIQILGEKVMQPYLKL